MRGFGGTFPKQSNAGVKRVSERRPTCCRFFMLMAAILNSSHQIKHGFLKALNSELIFLAIIYAIYLIVHK